MEKKRLEFVDVARGIAMICIIIGHLHIDAINRVVFTFHVPIFFFITGYFLSTRKPTVDFIKNRARTLLIPYLITCLVIIVLGTLKAAVLNGDIHKALSDWIYATFYGAGDTWYEPFYIRGIGAIWFLWGSFWGSSFLRISLQFSEKVRLLFIGALFAFGYFSSKLFWFPLSIQAGACATAFMYIGYLVRQTQDTWTKIPKEAKVFAGLFALITWIAFIKDFRSFWLVHSNFGRGIVDIFGCICASAIVLLISYGLEKKFHILAKPLAYFGKYSLIMLCVHVVEQDLFPWKDVTGKLVTYGMPASLQMPVLIVAKVSAVLLGTWILSHIRFVKKLFGYKV